MDLQRISWKYLSSEITDKWLGLDNKLARTFLKMSVRPHEVIEAFLGRNTVKYLGPFGYYVVVTAIMLIVFDLTGIAVDDFLRLSNESLGLQANQTEGPALEFQRQVSDLMTRYFRFIPGILIPFLGLSSMMLFRKLKKNYLELIVMNTYIQTHGMWLLIISLIIYRTTGLWLSNYVMGLSMLYYVWAATKVFPLGKIIPRTIRVICTWLVAYGFFIIITFVVALLYILFIR